MYLGRGRVSREYIGEVITRAGDFLNQNFSPLNLGKKQVLSRTRLHQHTVNLRVQPKAIHYL